MKFHIRLKIATVRSWLQIVLAFGMAALAGPSAFAQAQSAGDCGSLQTTTGGPWDYRIERGANREMVEKHHFTPQVEALINGVTVTRHEIAGDISYTLRAFPNHLRALIAMTRLVEQRKTNRPPAAHFTMECFFERALRFRPDDTMVRVLFAQYLGKTGNKDVAAQQLELATGYATDNPFSHYNIGLTYFELGMYDRALQQAHKSMALGMQRQELVNLLKRENKWQEPSG